MKKVCKLARKRFKSNGDTYYGYVFPDGKYIGMKGSHADVVTLYKRFKKPKGSNYYKEDDIIFAIDDFVKNCNCIMTHSESGETGIGLTLTAVKKPTSKQVVAIGKTLPNVKSLFAMRKDSPMGNDLCYIDMENPKPVHLQKWISKCW